MFEEYFDDSFDTIIRKKGNYFKNYYECLFTLVAVCLECYNVEIIRIQDSNKNVGRIQFIKHGERKRKSSIYSIEKKNLETLGLTILMLRKLRGNTNVYCMSEI